MERAIKNMEKHSLITNTKIELLRNGVNFNPLNMFSNYEDINKYKTKKIKVKPTIVGSEVYDLEKNSNILPSEVIYHMMIERAYANYVIILHRQ